MLAHDDGEEGLAEGVRQALEHAEVVAPDIRVLWRVGDEALLHELHGELVVGALPRVDRLAGCPFEPMLADDHRALLTGL